MLSAVRSLPGAIARESSLRSLPVVSWALYDFANTIFSYAVLTRFFNEWIIIERGSPDWTVGLMSFLVGVVLVVTLPVFGALADRYGRRKPFLVVFTLVCVVMTALLGVVDTITGALVVAGLGISGFQSALAHYDPLLADVAPEEVRGRVSGLGVGLGYVGVLFALVVLGLIVGDDSQTAFVPTAIMVLVFALPCFFFVRERSQGPVAHEPPLALVRDALAQVVRTFRNARQYSQVGRFLVGRFLYVDAVATLIAYMVVYADRVADLSSTAKNALVGLSVVCAAIGAFVAGAAVERYGPRRTLLSILITFSIGLVLVAATGWAWTLWVAGPIVGIALGTIWTSDRIWMLRLAPPDLRGEFFGLYAISGRLSSGVGPLVLWGATVWILSDATDVAGKAAASRVALVALAAAALAGVLVIRPLSDARPA
jgi:UMF1 family MFS transporter